MALAHLVVPATPSHAQVINSKYQRSQSNFVLLADRLNQTLAQMTRQAQSNWHANLKVAIRAFKRNHPELTTYSNRQYFRLCQAQDIALDTVVIDTTMQREPDLNWVLKIITNFRAYQAQPIQVYKHNDEWAAWDGQHTALALYLIARELGLDLLTEAVPANIYDIANRGEIRSNFINNNTTVGKNAGKKPLDLIDIVQQQIYGVLVDGVQDPEWVAMAEKHRHLAAAGLFLTARKFKDDQEPGAVSRVEEIVASSVEVVRQFCVYGEYIVSTYNRAIETKELPIIIEFLNMCERENIHYTDAQILTIAKHIDHLFQANFDADGPYWQQVHQANLNAYELMYRGYPKNTWPDAPKNLKNVPNGVTFFWYQLRKSWLPLQATGTRFPKKTYDVFVPAAADLW